VNLNMPVGNPPPPPKPPVVVQADVDFDGTIYWDGQALADRAMLEAKLRNVAAQPDQPEIHLRPNKLATYKYVAEVMASAQRLGVRKIGLVGNEQFIQ
jgi:biopolymer transport protein ExbD